MANHGLRKEVLVVDKRLGPLSSVVPWLEDMDFNVTMATSPAWVTELVDAAPPFAAVAVNGGVLGKDDERLYEKLCTAHPDTPVIWVESGKREAPTCDGRAPDSIVRWPCSTLDLCHATQRLLTARFFPERIVGMLQDACAAAVKDSFHQELAKQETYLKADPAALGNVSAMVSFVDEHFRGCIVISAGSSFFEGLHRGMVGDNEASVLESELEDVAGEACNLIAGRFKAALAKHNLDLTHSFPVIANSHPISLGYGGPGRIALVQPFDNASDNAECYLELCLDVFDPGALSNEVEPEQIDEGDMMFF